MIDLDSRCDQNPKGCRDMGKRTRLKWAPRVRQPRRPIKVTRTEPLHGPALYDHQELTARLVHRKAF